MRLEWAQTEVGMMLKASGEKRLAFNAVMAVGPAARIHSGKCLGFCEINFPVGSYLPVFFEAVLALSAVASASSSVGTDQPPPRAL